MFLFRSRMQVAEAPNITGVQVSRRSTAEPSR
jgi:hypothetical protein